MAVKVVRRRELTFWEKLYVPQILCGLKITFTHFFRNLFLHTAHLVGRFNNRLASATIQFPEELRPLMSRFRSRHRLTHREDHTPRCVGCMLCETVCPAKCITIVPGEHPDPNIEKPPPLLVPFPVKENENGVWALAGLEDKVIAAAIGKIQARYFLLATIAEHDA